MRNALIDPTNLKVVVSNALSIKKLNSFCSLNGSLIGFENTITLAQYDKVTILKTITSVSIISYQ